MLVKFAKEKYAMAANSTLSGKLEHAQMLQVDAGRVWLTVEGQSADVWLNAGDICTLPAHRLIVIEAEQSDSRFHLDTMQLRPLRAATPVAGHAPHEFLQAA